MLGSKDAIRIDPYFVLPQFYPIFAYREADAPLLCSLASPYIRGLCTIMKKFIQEFKEFALKGNMMDLAIGMIIGSAFTGIVNSLVNDIINPILGIFTGKIDFSNLFLTLDGSHYETLAAAEKAGAAVFKYGSFISNVINFIIMALVVFFIVKFLNKLRRPEPEKPAAPTTKKCPYCMSEISIEATRCPNCTSSLIDVDAKELS